MKLGEKLRFWGAGRVVSGMFFYRIIGLVRSFFELDSIEVEIER